MKQTEFKEIIFDNALYHRVKQNFIDMAEKLPSLLSALSEEGLPTDLKFLKEITKTDTAFYDFLQAEKEKHLRGRAFIPKEEIQRTERVYNDLYLQLTDEVGELRRMFFSGLPIVEVDGAVTVDAHEVEKLAKEGINKTDLSRDEFLDHAWDWTHKHGGIILEQLKKLGASCDLLESYTLLVPF